MTVEHSFMPQIMYRAIFYKVNVNTKAVTTIVTGIPYPISIFYEGSKNRLLVGTFTYSAEILYVDLLNNDSCKTLRNTSFGGISGIVADNKGNYFISQWIRWYRV